MKPAEEADFWGEFFDGGSFLLAGWDQVLGVGPVRGPEDWRAIQRSPEVVDAAREAWRRLGAEYLAGEIGPDRPVAKRGAWALAEFGEPESCQ